MAGADQNQTVVVDGHPVKLTNLDKVLYPATGTTKADVIFYYAQVAEAMLPHLRQRPVTRKRWPDGVGTPDHTGPVFFSKDLPRGTPDWVQRYVIRHKDHDNSYPVVNDLATLTWLAQLAALELHVPQWRFDAGGVPQPPDRLVLDLDPGEGVELAQCAEVAGWAREILAGIGHEPVPVTSGSKGIHLYAPLDGGQDYAGATEVARTLALALQADHPELVTAVMRRADRAGKVFIDWSQNNGAKTTIAPYSLRGRTRPWVAAPRTWAELADPDLAQLDYADVLERVGAGLDPFAALDTAGGDRLATYRRMRDASRTPEPVPAPNRRDSDRGPDEAPIFVIQEHHARRLHYDFRLARDGVLVSWAVPKGPPTDPQVNHLAVQTEDHPMDYATFEGTIPAGEYGGGRVSIWDAGTYRLEKWREGREVIVTLYGRPGGGLGGPSKFALIHTGGPAGQPEKNWLIHRMHLDPQEPAPTPTRQPDQADRAPSPSTGPTDRAPTPPTAEAQRALSLSKGPTDRTRSLSKGQDPSPTPDPPTSGAGDHHPDFPEPTAPMLATPAIAPEIHDEAEWAFEMKWDGVRVLVYLAAHRVRLQSRKGRDETAAYPDLIADLAAIPCERGVLDGEIVVLDAAGTPRFGLLQPRINLTRPGDIAAAARKYPARLMLFDILSLDSESLVRRPYDQRRAILTDLVGARPDSRVQVPPPFEGDLDASMETSRILSLEGVVAKRRNSVYQPGRRAQTWLKLKHRLTQDVVVAGWRPGQGRRQGGVGSLLLGVPTTDGLHYVGRVGSGFDDAELDRIDALVARLARKTNPMIDVPPEDARDAHWITPSQVAEVVYSEVTSAGKLRHPVWVRWRPDKSPEEVVWELPVVSQPT